MDKESFDNMVLEFLADKERLKVSIEKEIAKKQQTSSFSRQQSQATQMMDATHSPIFNEPELRKQTVSKVSENIRNANYKEGFDARQEAKKTFEERSKMLEEIIFKDYGGSMKKAKELLAQNEMKQDASQELNTAWKKETSVQNKTVSAYVSKDFNLKQGLDQKQAIRR